MAKPKLEHVFPEYLSSLYGPNDLIMVMVERNGCNYRWGVPFRNIDRLKELKEPYSFEDLQALEGTIQDIVVIDQFSIDFKQTKTGVQKLDVIVRSSESEDRQLLHKLTSEIRAKDQELNKDSLPGTKHTNDE